jgi:hypothetical protein
MKAQVRGSFLDLGLRHPGLLDDLAGHWRATSSALGPPVLLLPASGVRALSRRTAWRSAVHRRGDLTVSLARRVSIDERGAHGEPWSRPGRPAVPGAGLPQSALGMGW